MQRLGIVLGMVVAVCWGSADTVATVAARRLGTFTTTLVSLLVSVLLLVLFAAVAPSSLLAIPAGFGGGVFLEALTGVLAAIGYFSLYRGLELGPVAIVSPVVAADGAIAAVLAILLLREEVSYWVLGMLATIFVGIFFASTHLSELRDLMSAGGLASLVKGGVRWGLLATLAFGLMLFGIGVAAQQWGWFLPILWTRAFALLTMLAAASWKLARSRRFGSHPAQAGILSSMHLSSLSLAVCAGSLETVGLLVYSFDTVSKNDGKYASISV